MLKNSWENNKLESTSYALIIKGVKLNLDEISACLNFSNAKMIHAGEIISKVVGACEKDIYIYKENYENVENASDKLKLFLDTLIKKKQLLLELSLRFETSIRVFIQSSQAQMYFNFDSGVISKLNELQIPVELSILSWGEVLD